jgi:hypothetical protein
MSAVEVSKLEWLLPCGACRPEIVAGASTSTLIVHRDAILFLVTASGSLLGLCPDFGVYGFTHFPVAALQKGWNSSNNNIFLEGGEHGKNARPTASLPSVRRFSRNCENLSVSNTCGLTRCLIRTALSFFLIF